MIKLNKNKFKNQKAIFLKSLSKEDMKGYIDEILKKYLNCYLKGEIKETRKAIDEINNLILFLEDDDDYKNIRNYINYRLIIINNQALSSVLNRSENSLFIPSSVLIDETSIVNNRDMFDEALMQKIIQQEYYQDILDCIDFLDNIEDFTIPNKLAEKIESFINDVKDGKYDNCLNIKNNSLYDIVQ